MNRITIGILIILGISTLPALIGGVASIIEKGVRVEPARDKETGELIYDTSFEYVAFAWLPTLASSSTSLALLLYYKDAPNIWIAFIFLPIGAFWCFLSLVLADSATEHKWNPWVVNIIGTPVIIAVMGALVLSVTLTQDPTPRHGYSSPEEVAGESVTLYMDVDGKVHREELKRPIVGQILQNQYANDETVFWDERNSESKVVSASANKSDALGYVYNPVTFVEDLNPGDTPYAVSKVEYKLDKGVDPSEYPCATNKTDACKSCKLNATIVSESTTIHLPKGERNKYVKELPGKDSGK
jgi:hypothetical protein